MIGFAIGAWMLLPLQAAGTGTPGSDFQPHRLRGWEVQVSRKLLAEHPNETRTALEILEKQLREVESRVPAAAVNKLALVTLYMSPEYAGIGPKAEYHPGAEWLRDNGRDPVMVKSIEFTNIMIFESESRRMPNFALHELAHAYHDRFLPQGFDNPEIITAYERARASGTYDRVERRDADGRVSIDKAYAMVNAAEYFAETTEAFFSRNDFFPFDRKQLNSHDPAMYRLLTRLWSLP
jgi:hypothetical protein